MATDTIFVGLYNPKIGNKPNNKRKWRNDQINSMGCWFRIEPHQKGIFGSVSDIRRYLEDNTTLK